jgi:hypothetical protein
MKKLLLVLSLLTILGTANAQWHHHGGCCYRGSPFGWAGPALIGGVIGYELARPPAVYVEQQPVIIQQPVIQAPPAGYHWQEMIDPQTGIKKIVAVPN